MLETEKTPEQLATLAAHAAYQRAYRDPKGTVLSQWEKARRSLTDSELVALELSREKFAELSFYIKDVCEFVDYGNYHGVAGDDRCWPDSVWNTITSWLPENPLITVYGNDSLLDADHASALVEMLRKSDDSIFVKFGYHTKIHEYDFKLLTFMTMVWCTDHNDNSDGAADPYIGKDVAAEWDRIKLSHPAFAGSCETLHCNAIWRKSQLAKHPMSALEALQKVKDTEAQRWNRILQEGQ